MGHGITEGKTGLDSQTCELPTPAPELRIMVRIPPNQNTEKYEGPQIANPSAATPHTSFKKSS